MPYEEFPPLEESPPKAPDAASLAQAQGAANWAETFGKGDTNMMLRKRHNQDIARATEMNQAAQEAHQFNELKTNKGALDLFIRGRKLNMDLQLGEAQLRERAQKAEAAEELLPLELKAKETQIQLNKTRAVAAYNADQRKMEAEAREIEHGDLLDEHVAIVRRSGVHPGTPEYFRGVEEGLRKYHFAPPQMQQTLRGTAKIIPRPEDAPLEVTRTTEVVGDGTDQIRTERTVTSQKQSRAGYEATTPPAGADFLNQLGLKAAGTAPAAPTAQRTTPAPARPAATPTPAPDRAAIARKALSDPNASEAHKAAARRLLGE